MNVRRTRTHQHVRCTADATIKSKSTEIDHCLDFCGVSVLSGMHLLTFLQMKQPGPMFRGMVWLSQGIFTNFFFLAYLLSPKFCHRVSSHASTLSRTTNRRASLLMNTTSCHSLRTARSLSPQLVQLVGYLEEEAVKTYTETLKRQPATRTASLAALNTRPHKPCRASHLDLRVLACGMLDVLLCAVWRSDRWRLLGGVEDAESAGHRYQVLEDG